MSRPLCRWRPPDAPFRVVLGRSARGVPTPSRAGHWRVPRTEHPEPERFGTASEDLNNGHAVDNLSKDQIPLEAPLWFRK